MENISIFVSGLFIGLVLFLVPLLVLIKWSDFPRMLFNLYYNLERTRKEVFIVMFIFALVFGFMIYWVIYDLKFFQALYYGLSQFMFDIKTPAELGLDPEIKIPSITPAYYWIYLSAFVAALMSTLTIILLFFKEAIHRQYASYIINSNVHIIVCGLGKKAMAYIDSELDNKQVGKHFIVIEKNPNNPNIKRYREKYYDKEFAIKVGDATDIDVLNKLNIENCQHIVLLAGKDTENVEIALAVSDVLNKLKVKSKKIEYKDTYMHLEDRSLHKFYREGGLLDDSSLLHIKIFSMAQNSAKSLFLEHDIDGDSRKYIDSNQPFGIAIVGHSNLALEVIGQACEIAHFPNENVMTIYCIDNNIAAFRRLVYYKYPNIDEIPTINLEFKKLNFKSCQFYEESFWKKDVTNVILCYEEGQDNLDIASELADSTYLNNIKKKRMKTKIHIAIYENTQIARNINKNQLQFMYFDVFAETSKMASAEMIIEEKFEIISRCVHASYEERYEPWRLYNAKIEESHLTKIDQDWIDTARLSDRVSNRAQAYHIPIKLKALGFTYEDDNSSRSLCGKLKYNKLLMNKYKGVLNDNFPKIMGERKNLKLDDKALTCVTEKYFGDNKWREIEKFDKHYYPKGFITLFDKLIRSEHNRWNAHHYLKGWEFGDKDKELKIHDCLVSLEKMKKTNKFTILYDIYSVLYIPNYLAHAGYKLKIPLKLGITGHRKLNAMQVDEISETLKNEFAKLDEVYELIEVISPLADGADRIVAKILMDKYNAKLVASLPFKQKEYKKDFSEESQTEFDDLLQRSYDVYNVGSLEENTRDKCYLNVGKHVVDNCDILIALWNGKNAEGTGGTGDVVAYAKEKGKTVLHIDTITLKVNKINFKGEE